MARIRIWGLFATFSLAACQPGGTQLTARHHDALVDSIRTFLSEYVETINSGDFSTVTSYYVDHAGFHWAEDGRIRYPSWASLTTTIDSVAGATRSVSLVVDQPKIVPIEPGLAALTATYRQSLTDTAGQVLRSAGAFTGLVEHSADGWKFLLGHTSTNPDVR